MRLKESHTQVFDFRGNMLLTQNEMWIKGFSTGVCSCVGWNDNMIYYKELNLYNIKH